MMDKFKKLLEEKGESKLNPMQKKAKMSVLQDLKSQANEAMALPLKGLKKVSVMAKDEEGLKKGLEKAEQLIGSEADEANEDVAEELEEQLEPEHNLSLDQIEQKIAALQELKAQKMGMEEQE